MEAITESQLGTGGIIISGRHSTLTEIDEGADPSQVRA